MTWLVITLIALLSLLLAWRFWKLSERMNEIERNNQYRVEQVEREMRFYVYDLYDKVLGSNNRPSVGWWLFQAPVVMHDGKQVHLMDVVGYGSQTEAQEYAEVLGKKHGGEFKLTQLKLEEYQKLQKEQSRVLHASGGRYVAARPFFHHAGWLSDGLDVECGHAGDQEQDAQLVDLLVGSHWVDGRLIQAKSLWERVKDLREQLKHLQGTVRMLSS